MEFLDDDKKENITEFVKFARKELGLKKCPTIVLQNGKGGLKTTASYNFETEDKTIRINAKNRALVDIFRSIAHEMVHHKQWEDDRLKNAVEDGADGTEIENEAHSMAGLFIRKFGKINPTIYEL